MEKSNYEIRYLPSFNEELDEILYHITYKLKNKNAAKNLYESIEKSINKRSINPEGYEKYKNTRNRRYIWYRIYISNYTILYTVRNKTMEVAHIIYSKRNIDELI